MKTVGAILKDAREKKGFTLEYVEQATKIRKKFLQAIESDDFTQLPSQSYAKGFIKNYSEFLGLEAAVTLAFFRRQTKEVTKASLLPKGVSEPLNPSLFRLTPGRFLALILVTLVGMFLVYLGTQYTKIQKPPRLTIEAPPDKQVTNERRIDVVGKTDPDATVTINGVSVLVRSDGQFFDQVVLEPGANTITIAAVSRFGKSTAITREVGYQQ